MCENNSNIAADNTNNNPLRNILDDSLTELFSILLFGMSPTPVEEPAKEDEFVPRFRFAANYDMFGDMEGWDWARLVLNNAMERELIVDYDILLSLRGYMGLQNVTFTFDVDMPGVDGFAGLLEKGQEIASDIVGESDVNVYGVTILNLPDDTDGDEPEEPEDEPLAEWEKELFGDDAEKAEAEAASLASDEALATLRAKLTGQPYVAPTGRTIPAEVQTDAYDGCGKDCIFCQPDESLGSQDENEEGTEAEEENIADSRPGVNLCYDDWTGRYFYGSLDFIEKSVLQFNSYVQSEGDADLNTLYDLLGLTPIPMGMDFGWSENVSVNYGTMLSQKGKPCITMSFRNAPKPNLGQR